MTVKWERAELMKSEGIAESATICFQRFVTSNARPRGSWASLVATLCRHHRSSGSGRRVKEMLHSILAVAPAGLLARGACTNASLDAAWARPELP
jgi:hypothetical protein